MFETSLVESGRGPSGRTPCAVMVSAGAQAALLLAAVAWPLGQIAGLPPLVTGTRLEAPLPLAPAPVAARAPAFAATRLRTWSPPQPLPPQAPPLRAAGVNPAPAPTVLALPEAGGALPHWLGPALPEVAPPAPMAALPRAAPLRVGGRLQAARCLACPPPLYPDFARRLGLEGTVELRALIGSDGRVERLQRVQGNALLAAAAERTVHQWRFRPLRLNGRPVAVDTIITVHFRLSGG